MVKYQGLSVFDDEVVRRTGPCREDDVIQHNASLQLPKVESCSMYRACGVHVLCICRPHVL